MKIIKTFFDNSIKLIEITQHHDQRGYFSVSYNRVNFKKIKINDKFYQDNYSFSKNKNTLRGIHYQHKPYEQSKLINVINGSVFDVFVDLRLDSNTYGQFQSTTINSNNIILYIPAGFGHAICTLEKNTLVHYKVSNKYSPKNEETIIWDDPDLRVKWPKFTTNITLSDKDKNGISLKDFESKVKRSF